MCYQREILTNVSSFLSELFNKSNKNTLSARIELETTICMNRLFLSQSHCLVSSIPVKITPCKSCGKKLQTEQTYWVFFGLFFFFFLKKIMGKLASLCFSHPYPLSINKHEFSILFFTNWGVPDLDLILVLC